VIHSEKDQEFKYFSEMSTFAVITPAANGIPAAVIVAEGEDSYQSTDTHIRRGGLQEWS